mgnify:CR=1 FL=1
MQCIEKISKDIETFMQDAGLNEAYLFGGAVLDTQVNPNAEIHDYDVCVKDYDVFMEALQNIERNGCTVSEVMHTHNYYVAVKHPTLGDVDFSCMNPEDNGIFNIEKIYAKFRKKNEGYVNEIIDNYDAIESIKQGRIRLACDPKAEGSYNLLRRFMAIVGKYGVDTSVDGINQPTIDRIKNEFKEQRHFVPQDKVRCLSRLTASLRRSKNRQEYVQNFGQQHLFADAYPVLDKLLNNENFVNHALLERAETQKELLELMMLCTPKQDRDEMIDCLRILAKREPARQDKGVKSFVDNIENEKTSINRLNNEILTPLMLFKMGQVSKKGA